MVTPLHKSDWVAAEVIKRFGCSSEHELFIRLKSQLANRWLDNTFSEQVSNSDYCNENAGRSAVRAPLQNHRWQLPTSAAFHRKLLDLRCHIPSKRRLFHNCFKLWLSSEWYSLKHANKEQFKIRCSLRSRVLPVEFYKLTTCHWRGDPVSKFFARSSSNLRLRSCTTRFWIVPVLLEEQIELTEYWISPFLILSLSSFTNCVCLSKSTSTALIWFTTDTISLVRTFFSAIAIFTLSAISLILSANDPWSSGVASFVQLVLGVARDSLEDCFEAGELPGSESPEEEETAEEGLLEALCGFNPGFLEVVSLPKQLFRWLTWFWHEWWSEYPEHSAVSKWVSCLRSLQELASHEQGTDDSTGTCCRRSLLSGSWSSLRCLGILCSDGRYTWSGRLSECGRRRGRDRCFWSGDASMIKGICCLTSTQGSSPFVQLSARSQCSKG